jgi:glycosyltransferase involved in cell wall biosynthesis
MKKIILSQPFRQHSPQLLRALQRITDKVEVFTLLNTSAPAVKFIFSLPILSKMKPVLAKRSFGNNHSPIHSTGIIAEIRRNIQRRRGGQADEVYDFIAEKHHDVSVAAAIKEPVILIGYEKSCLASFQKNRSLGGINILDMAGVYHTKLSEMRNTYTIYSDTLPPQPVFEQICERKEAEIALADHIIVLSSMVKDELLKAGVSEAKISVVQLGYDPLKFTAKQNYSIQGPLRVIFVGAFSYRKGVGDLLKAAEMLKDEAVHFIFVGPASDASALLQTLPSNCEYVSYLDHTGLAAEYRKADVFVLPSYLDSYGMVVAEAMASGLPVIVSENTGAKDIIADAGFVIPVNDPVSLCKYIRFFMNDRTMVEAMGRKAASIATSFQWDHYYDQIKTIISKMKINQ